MAAGAALEIDAAWPCSNSSLLSTGSPGFVPGCSSCFSPKTSRLGWYCPPGVVSCCLMSDCAGFAAGGCWVCAWLTAVMPKSTALRNAAPPSNLKADLCCINALPEIREPSLSALHTELSLTFVKVSPGVAGIDHSRGSAVDGQRATYCAARTRCLRIGQSIRVMACARSERRRPYDCREPFGRRRPWRGEKLLCG